MTAELPDMDERDVEVFVEDSALNLRGEKKSAIEDKGSGSSKRGHGPYRSPRPGPAQRLNLLTAKFGPRTAMRGPRQDLRYSNEITPSIARHSVGRISRSCAIRTEWSPASISRRQ